MKFKTRKIIIIYYYNIMNKYTRKKRLSIINMQKLKQKQKHALNHAIRQKLKNYIMEEEEEED
jgi:hypothetical protein